MDPVMPQAVGAILLILMAGIVLRLIKQPSLLAYLIAGVVIGPSGIALIADAEFIARLGAFGVVLLLFFVGMETDAHKLASNWRLAIVGTFVQILLSITCSWILGILFDWPLARIILIGFVISLSSTAIIIKLLQDSHALDTKIGQGVLSILLAQDLAIIPMLIILGVMSSGEMHVEQLVKQGLGALLAVGLFAWMLIQKQIRLPLSKLLLNDKELQLFASLAICFGVSLITAWFELSTALGAFIGGMLIGAARETQWVHHALEPLKVLFVAIFFVSIGMLVDIDFLLSNWVEVALLVIAAFVTNTIINAGILRASGFNWREGLYAGALLAQIGEFSFVLAAVGMQTAIINEYGYQLALSVICLSLVFSPGWIGLGASFLKEKSKVN
jgi:CPA2 family monovalent cation:H+ antiporter-2